MTNITNTPFMLAVVPKIDLFFLKATPSSTGYRLQKMIFKIKAHKFHLKLLKTKKKQFKFKLLLNI